MILLSKLEEAIREGVISVIPVTSPPTNMPLLRDSTGEDKSVQKDREKQ